jgi:predicted hydrolase (HD superfamily)
MNELHLTREQASEILHKYLKNTNLLKHSYAAEAAMKAIYERFYLNDVNFSLAEEEKWGITG